MSDEIMQPNVEINKSVQVLRLAIPKPGFNRDIIVIMAVLIGMMIVLRCMHLELQYMWSTVSALLLLVPCFLPVLAYGKQTGRTYWADIVIMTYSTMFLTYLLRFPCLIAARLGSAFDLRDSQLMRFDEAFGVSVPAIVNWASTHWLGRIADSTYAQIPELLMTAAVLPAVMGHVKDSHLFIRAILLGFLIGLPLFILVPVVGPWYGYRMARNSLQAHWETNLLLIRNQSTAEVNDVVGIIGFPSFHVSWALTAAYYLWSIQWIRLPVSVLAVLIVMSTLTGGFHYFADVISGVLITAASIWLAEKWERVSETKEDLYLSAS